MTQRQELYFTLSVLFCICIAAMISRVRPYPFLTGYGFGIDVPDVKVSLFAQYLPGYGVGFGIHRQPEYIPSAFGVGLSEYWVPTFYIQRRVKI